MKYSIIIPVYNVEVTQFNQCINSILKQPYKDYEVLVIDDGSNADLSSEYVRITEGVPQVHIIHQKNMGVSVARNNGIDHAKGEWIIFIDADDWVEDDFFSILNDNINDNIDILIYNAYLDINNKKIKNYFWDYPNEFHCENKYLLQIQAISSRTIDRKKPQYNTVGVPWGKCYNANLLKNNNIRFIQGLKINEDMLFNLYAIEVAKNIKYIDRFLYNYRKSDKSVTGKFRPDDINIHKRIIEEFNKFYHEYRKYDIDCFNKAYAFKMQDIYISLCFNYFLSPDNKQKISILKTEIKSLPIDMDYINSISLNNFSKFTGFAFSLFRKGKLKLARVYYNIYTNLKKLKRRR